MSLPTEVFVAPHRVKFVYSSDPKMKQDAEEIRVFGYFTSENSRIVVDQSLSPTRTADTILHEVLHAVQASSPFVDPDDEEDVIKALAPALVRLIQDNPGFFPQIVALAAQK